MKKTFGAIPFDAGGSKAKHKKGEEEADGPLLANEDSYENFLFRDIAVGLLAIYFNMIESLQTNSFHINGNQTNQRTLSTTQTVGWHGNDDLKSLPIFPRTLSQAQEEFEFMKVSLTSITLLIQCLFVCSQLLPL